MKYFYYTFRLAVFLCVAYLVYNFINEKYIIRILDETKSIKGVDEYVLTEITSGVTVDKNECIVKLPFPLRGCGSWERLSFSFEAHYKYYINLAFLKHSIESGVLYLEVPNINLSTPVAYDKATQKCDSILFDMCKKSLNSLLKELPEILDKKGIEKKSEAYDVAAKTLADNVNKFVENNYFLPLLRPYSKISVKFLDENSVSIRQYDYN